MKHGVTIEGPTVITIPEGERMTIESAKGHDWPKLFVLIAISAVLSAIAFAGLTSCTAVKNVVRTIDDVASDLCLLTATEVPPEQLQGFNPKEWCQVKEHLQPFIDEALSAQRAAAGGAGLSLKESTIGDAGP